MIWNNESIRSRLPIGAAFSLHLPAKSEVPVPVRRILLLLAFLLSPAVAADTPTLKVSSAKTDPPAALAKEVRAALDPMAVVLADDAGTRLTLCFRADIPSGATADQVANGLTYLELAEGTLVAVVRFDKPFTDFRKQEIPAGTYTLRMAVQPDIGDHKETAPHQDFCLLVPAANDTTTEPVEVKELIPLSRKATGADHPAVMLLFPHYGKEAEPKLVAKPNGVSVVQLRRPVTAGDKMTTIGFAVVVAGTSPTRK